MAAAVSSLHGTSPNVAAPPVTVENAVKSTSAGTTVRMEEHAPHHAQVHTRRHCAIVARALHIYLYSYISNTVCFLSSGAPTCRCQTGFTGSRCEQHTCNNYCQNEGTCTVSQGNQPTCRCPKGFLGDQCQYREFDSLSL